jgi:hypothetical protein
MVGPGIKPRTSGPVVRSSEAVTRVVSAIGVPRSTYPAQFTSHYIKRDDHVHSRKYRPPYIAANTMKLENQIKENRFCDVSNEIQRSVYGWINRSAVMQMFRGPRVPKRKGKIYVHDKI